MKFHVRFNDTGKVRHFWAGQMAALILELTADDVERLKKMPPNSSGRVLMVAAPDGMTRDEIRSALDQIENRPPDAGVRQLVYGTTLEEG